MAVDGAGNAWPSPGSTPAFVLAPGADPSDPFLQSVVAELLQAGLYRQVASVGRGPGGAFRLATPDGWTLDVAPRDLAGQWRKYVAARPWVAAWMPGRKTMDLRWQGRVVLAAPPAAEGGNGDG